MLPLPCWSWRRWWLDFKSRPSWDAASVTRPARSGNRQARWPRASLVKPLWPTWPQVIDLRPLNTHGRGSSNGAIFIKPEGEAWIGFEIQHNYLTGPSKYFVAYILNISQIKSYEFLRWTECGATIIELRDSHFR